METPKCTVCQAPIFSEDDADAYDLFRICHDCLLKAQVSLIEQEKEAAF